ncbi:MAG: hypothetical protein H7Y88_06205, partial [Phycisphaerales bacterium]|nr:hypothetical protein [Phycisphaerales bacterium]
MNVLHVISSLEQAAGGPQAVITRLGAAQALAGCHVTILSSRVQNPVEHFREILAGVPGGNSVQVELVEPFDRAERLTAARARARLRELLP